MRLAGAGGRRLRPPGTPGADRASSPARLQHLPAAAPRWPTGAGRAARRATRLVHRQRQGLPGHPGRLQAGPARAGRHRADRLLHLAGRGAPGLPEPARRRVRHGAGRRRVASRSPQAAGYLYEEGGIALPGRPLPRLRRRRAGGTVCGNGVGVVVLQAGSPTRSPTATTSTRSSAARRSTTTAPRKAGLHRAERRRPGRGDRRARWPWPASTPAPSATSRRTAPAPRSATRSRSPR